MGRASRKYTKEFKQESVTLALKSPSIAQAAAELGIPAATLYSWVYQLKNKAQVKTVNEKSDNQNIAALIEENRRLHKELAITREEREILKKAAAYFAQHQK
jgi:transposase